MMTKVAYNYLGRSGVKVSNLCLGTLTFGERTDGKVSLNEADSHKLLDRFVQCGGNFIDTANSYNNGNAERVVGSWLSRQRRENLVIATKVFSTHLDRSIYPNAGGLSRRNILAGIEESLQRLQTNYVDLYQIHCWDYGTPIEETLQALDELVKCGKVRYLGASNVTGWQLQKIVDLTKSMGLNKWITLQPQYSLLCRETEFEVLEVCDNEGIGVLPWSPLKGGALTGKYKKDEELPKDARLQWVKQSGRTWQSHPQWSKFSSSDQYWNIMAVLDYLAKEHGKTIPQVAIRWLLQKRTVNSVIIGATSLSQLDDNLGAAAGWELTIAEMAHLDTISSVELPYPYVQIRNMGAARAKPDAYCKTYH